MNSLFKRCALLLLFLIVMGVPGFGQQPKALRVIVLNMHAGKDAAGVDNLPGIAALVKKYDPDLVLLQEVDRGVQRSGRVDQPAALARMTGLYASFGKSLDYQGGDYGIAILSRWRPKKTSVLHLAVTPPQTRAGGSKEPRAALRMKYHAGKLRLIVWDTHLDPSRDDTYRNQEVNDLVRAFPSVRDSFFLLGGDFNSTPDNGVHQALLQAGLQDAWLGCGEGEGMSFPQDKPRKRIDYLYLSPAFHCTSARVLEEPVSDHRGVFFEISVSPPGHATGQ
jgi:endonuclease/exonuclease/phosphatase family metal-dependent hydrolase